MRIDFYFNPLHHEKQHRYDRQDHQNRTCNPYRCIMVSWYYQWYTSDRLIYNSWCISSNESSRILWTVYSLLIFELSYPEEVIYLCICKFSIRLTILLISKNHLSMHINKIISMIFALEFLYFFYRAFIIFAMTFQQSLLVSYILMFSIVFALLISSIGVFFHKKRTVVILLIIILLPFFEKTVIDFMIVIY